MMTGIDTFRVPSRRICGEVYTSADPMFGGGEVKVVDVTAETFDALRAMVRRAKKHGWQEYLPPDKEDMRAVLIRPLKS